MRRIHTDCIYFNGYKPCFFHKTQAVRCGSCPHYRKFNEKILIIKLRAAGEVIRNTPLLRKLAEVYPKARIFWLTEFPELIPREADISVLDFNLSSTLFLLDQSFDIVYSLDKDLDACSLANRVDAPLKKGFSQKNGAVVPFDPDAREKWETGVFDDLMARNSKHYVEELFEICGFKWRAEHYMLPAYPVPEAHIPAGRKIVGLNTGAGPLWKTRRFSQGKWLSLIEALTPRYEVVLLGGPEEDSINTELSAGTGALYFGVFEFPEFIGLMSKCDLVVTSVTAALHIAIGLNKKIVLLNNIFPANEFHLYGLGTILEPDLPCKKCYKAEFDNSCHSADCLDLIENDAILDKIRELL